MPDFTNLEYLKTGNDRQKKVYDVLVRFGIVECLKPFDPILTGTIPIAIDLPESDLDIICHCTNHSTFQQHLEKYFGNYRGFTMKTNWFNSIKASIARFNLEGFQVEIFGQNMPTRQQNAYRHMLIENRLLIEKGEDFRRQVIALKKQGIKTEPAFAQLLGLKGDPYQELLRYKSELFIREIKPSEYPFLKETLYLAIFIPQGQPPFPRPIIEKPELRKYYENFGKPGDFCLVAETNMQLVGAIWIRLFDALNKSYGFIDAETPEVSIAVLPEYRNQGIGTRMLENLLDGLKNGPYPQISLSVDAINFAYTLYKKHGFVDQFTVEGSVTMVKKIY